MSITYKIEKTEYGVNFLNIEFNNLKLTYDLSDFFKDNVDLSLLFEFINSYFASLDNETNEEIFNEFVKIYKFYEENMYNINNKQFIEKIENKIAKVCRLIDFNNFKVQLNWVSNRIFIPDNVTEEFIYDPDLTVTKEKTYIKSEYIGLVALSMMFRIMLPMYIQYYNYIKHITNFYFYKIFILFIKTDLFISDELNKLREYVENIQESLEEISKKEYLIIDSGFSVDDIIDNIIAEIIFTKLIGNDYFNKKVNIISFIFQTIKFKLKFTGTEGNTIRNKVVKNDPEKEDISYFEDYRKTSEVSIGTVAELQLAYDNIFNILKVLNIDDFDFNEYKKESLKLNILLTKRINKVQIILLGWLLHKYLNPRSLFYIENKKLYELLILAKIILKKKGFKFLSVLMTSYESSESNFVQVGLVKPNTKYIYNELKDYYSLISDEEKFEMIEKIVNEIITNIYNTNWVPLSTKEELEAIESRSEVLTVPYNLTEELVEYIKFCNS